jgi:hypothetical protein
MCEGRGVAASAAEENRIPRQRGAAVRHVAAESAGEDMMDLER